MIATMIPLLLLLAFSLLLKASYPKLKGMVGESRVKKLLSKLDKGSYKLWNDLYIPNSKQNTSQVDHVLLSENGLFVLETKNYAGWIFGNENSRNWTQVIYKQKEKFYNPIWQNHGHIQALKEYLQEELPNDFPIYSIIVFSNEATLKNDASFEKAIVIQNKQLLATIKKLYSNPYTGPSRIDHIRDKLASLEITSLKEKKQTAKKHVKQIKSDLKDNKQKIKKNICPCCGSKLVKRRGKNGSFTGCSSFPKCRFTKTG
ncbi:NERD domain-containing protein [Niallia nealsonii]|uniref:NERD domain-containing protein n=1 Tax=Niallia nealsonii TaxID=115979 RepID=A0A2N0Z5I3_9BACI|nr:NERD domain-containing protein [Niallia nealsonii]PKG24760.1 hypothetical protein CWS01_05800 [Niallia nealsonii]